MDKSDAKHSCRRTRGQDCTHGTEIPFRNDHYRIERNCQRCAEKRIENALRIVAELLDKDEAYLPIFLRLEDELKKAENRSAALVRASAFLGHQLSDRDAR